MIRTGFDGKRHGFRFANGTFDFTVAGFSCSVLCGGMSYAALDYYYNQLDIPDASVAPASGTPLFNYLYDRQKEAHISTLPGPWVSNLFNRPSGGAADPCTQHTLDVMIPELARRLRHGPVVLFLIREDFGKAHHVVASGMDLEPLQRVYLYDPNYPYNPSSPDNDVSIWYSPSLKTFYPSKGSARWRGFYIDDGYRLKTPPVQTGIGNWRLCAKCYCLYNDTITKGACPAGGAHQTFTKTEYLVPAKSGRGQGGWHSCAKCNSMYFDGGGLSCVKGGMHDSAGYEYFIPTKGGSGQTNWRCCIFCSCLFHQPPGKHGGVCPAGGEHDKAQSQLYSVPIKA
ncbi:MAG: hypothetical protein AB7F89_18360 [Pirellulaceae bacterium]